MNKIVMIKIPGCPYCANARKAFEDFRSDPRFADMNVVEIDETTQPELAKPYGGDYYYVPSLFVNGRKCFEAKPGMSYQAIKNGVEKALEAAIL